MHAHLAVASGGALAEAAGHGQGLGAEGHGVAGLGEGAVEVGVGAELRGGDIAVAGGEAVGLHGHGTHPGDEVGKLVGVRHDEFNHGGGGLGARQTLEHLVESVDAANKAVVGASPDALAELGVVSARLKVAFESHESSSTLGVCRERYRVGVARGR